MTRRPLIAGNWKMNGLLADGLALTRSLKQRIASAENRPFDMLVCPPATLVRDIAQELRGSGIDVGGQDCNAATSGAHTGDVAAPMLADAGATHIIAGHSERRHDHGESDETVRAKAEAVLAVGLVAVICIGETEPERDAGQTLAVLSTQLDGSIPRAGVVNATTTIIAYEPVWAIGTGRTPTLAQVDEAHRHIRTHLRTLVGAENEKMRILYGGSVKPDNAVELMAIADVDGALVGGASLNADAFWAIAQSCPVDPQ